MKNRNSVLLGIIAATVLLVPGCGKRATDSPTRTIAQTPSVTEQAPEPAGKQDSPTEPRDLQGIHVVLSDWWSTDAWNQPNNAYEAVFYDMLHDAEKEHNFTFERKRASFEVGDYQEGVALSITNNNPTGSIIAIKNWWVAPFLQNDLLLDVSKSKSVDWDDDKWNASVREIMSINGATYGFSDTVTPGTGVFFNRELFVRLGIDPELPYDLQKKGEWDWEHFSELCAKLTKDTDGDGAADIFAVVGRDDIVANCALQANGTFVVTKTQDGGLRANADDPAVKEAMEFVRRLHDDGVFMPEPEDAAWDWSKDAFCGGKAAMYIEEEWADTQEIRRTAPDLDYGFVCYPYGPSAGKTISILDEIIYAVPNCEATKAVAEDILYAYNCYTDKPECYCEDGEWKARYDWKFNDVRAVDETIRRMIKDGPFSLCPGILIPDFSDAWCRELASGKSVKELLSMCEETWKEQAEEFNEGFR